MPNTLPQHTIKRWVTDWGFGHAILLNPNNPNAAWAVIDAYGDIAADRASILKPDSELHNWEVVYSPLTPAVYPVAPKSDHMPTGTVRRLSQHTHAIKVINGDWLVYHREELFAVAAPKQVASWRVVYVPASVREWAHIHGLRTPLGNVHNLVLGRA